MGLEWYKREPQAYLRDTQGMTSREHAVYSVILDLIYAHGGSVNNDPRWISGWIADMGAAAVRNVISALVERGTLAIEGDQITQKRAKIQAKRRENAGKTEENPEKNEAFSEGECSENNEITPLEKRREEKSKETHPDGCGADAPPEGFWDFCAKALEKSQISNREARSILGRWTAIHGRDEVRQAVGDAMQAADPVAYVEAILKQKRAKGEDLDAWMESRREMSRAWN